MSLIFKAFPSGHNGNLLMNQSESLMYSCIFQSQESSLCSSQPEEATCMPCILLLQSFVLIFPLSTLTPLLCTTEFHSHPTDPHPSPPCSCWPAKKLRGWRSWVSCVYSQKATVMNGTLATCASTTQDSEGSRIWMLGTLSKNKKGIVWVFLAFNYTWIIKELGLFK